MTLESSAAVKLRDFDDPEFNPFFEESLAYGTDENPYPRFHELRESGAVIEGDFRKKMGLLPDVTYPADVPHYMVLGYKECMEVLTNPTVFSNKAYAFNLGQSFGRALTTMDQPEHTKYRRIFQKAFLPQNIFSWGENIVAPVVSELIDDFIPTGKADLVKQFTHHYPFRVIYRQLALPPDEAIIFHRIAIAQTLVATDLEHAVEAADKLGEYFPKVIDARRKNPGEDLISLLAGAEVDGEYLPEDVLVAFLRLLINAGGDTTYRGTSILFTRLLSNVDMLEAVRNDRTLIANAIDEAIRIDGPLIMQERWAAQDSEIAGVKIPAGSLVHVCAGAANRDPKVFPDPDRFDIFRDNAKKHIGFGSGPHVCIGQHLARIEMTTALNAIIDRLSNLRLDKSMPEPQVKGTIMRVPQHIYVEFDAA